MRHRSTVILFVLFLAGLGLLWWADSAGIKTRREQAELSNRLLPGLVDTDAKAIRRLEISRGSGAESNCLAVVVERRADGAWQMVRPTDAAADGNLIETLVRNLKDLRKSPDSGAITGDPTPYGLDQPLATVAVFGPSIPGSLDRPLATLEVGRKDAKRLYVRPAGGQGIEVVDAVLLDALNEPPTRWRDTALFHVPSFNVQGVEVLEATPRRDVALRRDDRHWRLLKPIRVPADDDKVEGLVAELAALRVADGADGFVKDGVATADRAAFGLETPSMTITITPFASKGLSQTLFLGKAVADKPDQVYARRGDQDDVVRLDVKRLREALPSINELRSQTVLDLVPQRVARLRIEGLGKVFDLSRAAKGWRLLGEKKNAADTTSIQTLLTQLVALKASEYFEPGRIANPRLEPPSYRIQGWYAEEKSPGTTTAPTSSPSAEDEARFDLSLGRHDAIRKTIYARVAGDSTILAVPDTIVASLPSSPSAYRDRSLLALNAPDFVSLTVERGASRVTVEAPDATGPANRWTIVTPVQAPANQSAVTSLILTLANLRADQWESENVGDGKAFGLDDPPLVVRWALRSGPVSAARTDSTGRSGALRIGKAKPKSALFYAQLEGDPRVFSLSSAVLSGIEGELRDPSVLSFKPNTAQRVVIRWPSRTVTLNQYPVPGSAVPTWQPALGYEMPIDLARAASLVNALGELKTSRFLQYDGPIPVAAGLENPRVAITIKVAGESREKSLRVGNALTSNSYMATTAAGDSGPVFILAVDPSWKEWLKPPARVDDLPEEIFTPLPSSPKPAK